MTQDTNTLKPCDCGSTKLRVKRFDRKLRLECKSCGFTGPGAGDVGGANAAWNRRAPQTEEPKP